MKTTIRHAAAVAALMLSLPALTAAPAAAQPREDAAWKWLDQAMAPTLTEEQRPKLIWGAYNATAGGLCHEVTVDSKKLGELLASLLPEEGGDVSPEQRHHLETSLMVHLGAAMGIYAAENADNLTEFCADAVALRDDKELTNDLFLPVANGEGEAEKK